MTMTDRGHPHRSQHNGRTAEFGSEGMEQVREQVVNEPLRHNSADGGSADHGSWQVAGGMAGGNSFVPQRHRLPASELLPPLLLLLLLRCCRCCCPLSLLGTTTTRSPTTNTTTTTTAASTRDRPSHYRRSTGKQRGGRGPDYQTVRLS
jgi:hypothetical protein